mmetsp:Transcript_127643/g.408529  ORF Transcript_127643/g.408529 Transcript_127643/m.408529 type:complete len:279 (+) Transcript_127643:42-878(+)
MLRLTGNRARWAREKGGKNMPGSHHDAMLAELPPCRTPFTIHQDATLRVLSTDCASQRVFVTAIPAAGRMSPTEDATFLAQARLPGLQLPPLLDPRLPKVMTDIAEVGGAKAEIMGLPLAAVAALPAEELRAVLRALKLALGGAPSAHELHGQRCLHVFIQVLLLLFIHICTLNLSAIIRLLALRAFEERHLVHGEACQSVLVARVAGLRERLALLHDPALECLSADLLVQHQMRTDDVVDGRVLHYGLAEGASDALEGEPPSAAVPLPDHGLGTMMV